MKKYYAGLILLALLTFGLSIFVIGAGARTKQDSATEKKAQEIAERLNSYISKNNKIPDSLATADIKDAPDSISYTKQSAERYEFCVTYKTQKGYGTENVTGLVTGALVSGMYGSAAAGSDYSSSSNSSYEPSSLYLSYTHRKGKDCQTIKPYIRQTYPSSSSSSSTDYDYCDPSGAYYKYYKSYCKDGTLTL